MDKDTSSSGTADKDITGKETTDEDTTAEETKKKDSISTETSEKDVTDSDTTAKDTSNAETSEKDVTNAETREKDGTRTDAPHTEVEIDANETDRLNTFTVECPDDEEDSSLQEEVQVRKLAWACRNETVCAPLIGLRKCLENFVKNNSSEICLWIKYTFIALFLVYMGFAFTLKKEFGREGWIRLLVITVVVAVVLFIRQIRPWRAASKRFKRVTGVIWKVCRPVIRFRKRYASFINRFLCVLAMAAVAYFVITKVAMERPRNLVSGVGIVVILAAMFLMSKFPRHVEWRPVGWGLLLQFIFALLVLRTHRGEVLFLWFSDRMTEYMNYTDSGASFVFGENYRDHYFAFRVMSTVIFFSATLSVLHYLGVMRVIIRAFAVAMDYTMKTGAMETLHAAFNIFCGWAESLMMVQPFLESMTVPELHAVMVNGLSTVATSTMGAYLALGVPANHLVTASFMSAPAALALAKMSYPNDRRALKPVREKDLPRRGTGVIDAAALGAVTAIPVVCHILVTAIAFICLLGFVNATLQWFGERVGLVEPDYPTLTFQLICSYLLYPVALFLGVRRADCKTVGRLLGLKIFANEYVAYSELGIIRANRLAFESHVNKNGTWNHTGVAFRDVYLVETNTTLPGGVISHRSETLATYALCGFANLMSVCMMAAALSAAAPSRRAEVWRLAPRALLTGIMTCLLTSALAGLVIVEL
ncbi:hypothetical protein BaRGS_00024186 [Batillaria attramentaria]|uniref:Uncharacterized protein n=1 Tax=Batillaria attramentaria TaxID=370345 RepID=A0ABD0KBQ6_9CAEN